MMALSVRQPWAAIIASGRKRYEFRTWRTDYRGPLAIHAAQGHDPTEIDAAIDAGLVDADGVWLGAIVAVALLVDIVPAASVAAQCGPADGCPVDGGGFWAWELADVRALADPVEATGALRLWAVAPAIAGKIEMQIPRHGDAGRRRQREVETIDDQGND